MLLCDSGKCVCVAKSNFLLNMSYCSEAGEIYTGISGHQSNTKFLTDVGIYELLFDIDMVEKM